MSTAYHDARNHSVTVRQNEYSRILTAAVVNAHFRQLLLSNPGMAISSGYGGEMFHLPKEEKKRVSSIRASSLEDFASQLTQGAEISRSGMACMSAD